MGEGERSGEVRQEVRERTEGRGDPYYPHHFIRQIISVLVVLGILILLVGFLPRGLGTKIDPYQPAEVTKPGWYLLAFEKVMTFGGSFTSFLGPVLMFLWAALLLFWPLLDRSKERRLRKRLLAVFIVVTLLLLFVVLTIIS